MAKELLSTQTDLYKEEGSIKIYSYFWKKVISIISAFITESTGIYNNISHIEGYLLATKEVNGSDLWVNDNGELIIKDVYANNYSIDSEGNLIYTE